MARKEVQGGALAVLLNGSITTLSTSVALTGILTGWPTGSVNPFVVTIDPGTASEEKCLCSSLSGNTLTFSSRGFDGTTAQAHSSGATIVHALDADSINDLFDHAYNTARDNHAQYLRTDGTRGLTGATAIVGTPVGVGTANAPGASLLLSRADHVHDIADGAIDHAALFAAGAVDLAALAANSVDATKIVDGSVGTAELAALAVTAAKIAADAIDASKLADNAVDTNAIQALAVTVAKLADGAVTLAKMNLAVWPGSFSVTSNASGDCVVTHGAPFTPSVVLVEGQSPAGGGGWSFGPHIVTAITATTFTVQVRNGTDVSPGNIFNGRIAAGKYVCFA